MGGSAGGIWGIDGGGFPRSLVMGIIDRGRDQRRKGGALGKPGDPTSATGVPIEAAGI